MDYYRMFYVYHLTSISHPGKHYIGFTTDLRQRFGEHNAGKNISTKPFTPWDLDFYAAFRGKTKALAFERCLKTGSGTAFGKKRLW